MAAKARGEKESLLLHVCCAPCSIAVIEELRGVFDLSVLFYNPNVFPADEYRRRKDEVMRVCTGWGVPRIDLDHEAERWEDLVAPLGPGPEGGPRCSACYRLRLSRTAECARELGFGCFASSLSMGRQKKSAVINAIGRTVGDEFGVKFMDTDWKKGGRWERGRQLTSEYGIYRQEYCGCRFSLAEARRSGRMPSPEEV